MARIKLSNKQFSKMLNNIINDIKSIHGSKSYGIEFDDDGSTAYITQPDHSTFYTTHLDRFTALETIYDCSMWFSVKNDLPCLVFMND